jgi:hypothetical protein
MLIAELIASLMRYGKSENDARAFLQDSYNKGLFTDWKDVWRYVVDDVHNHNADYLRESESE